MSDILQTQEEYTEGDFQQPSFEPVAEGWHKVVIDEVKGEEKHGASYSYNQACLVMTVVDENDEDHGRKIFDRINLPHPSEKQGNKNRRALVLSGLGVIQAGQASNLNFNWLDLQGVECCVLVEHNQGTSKKTGEVQTYANVAFDGYKLDIDNTPDIQASDDFADI